jgi:hypothetical protein
MYGMSIAKAFITGRVPRHHPIVARNYTLLLHAIHDNVTFTFYDIVLIYAYTLFDIHT